MAQELILGGVLFGMNYGILNSQRSSRYSLKEAMEILEIAIRSDVKAVDSASAYGNSEELLGYLNEISFNRNLRIITKLSTMSNLALYDSVDKVLDETKINFFRSLQVLGGEIDTFLLHRFEHYSSWGGVIWHELKKWQKIGLIKKIGISVQSPEELNLVLDDESVNTIQLPFNLLDWRWGESIDKINTIKKYRAIEIHARSIFLQGLLLTSERKLWQNSHVQNICDIQEWVKSSVYSYNCKSVTDLCIRYVKSHKWIDGLIIGVGSKQELLENLSFFQGDDLSFEKVMQINKKRPYLARETLDPSKWLIN